MVTGSQRPALSIHPHLKPASPPPDPEPDRSRYPLTWARWAARQPTCPKPGAAEPKAASMPGGRDQNRSATPVVPVRVADIHPHEHATVWPVPEPVLRFNPAAMEVVRRECLIPANLSRVKLRVACEVAAIRIMVSSETGAQAASGIAFRTSERPGYVVLCALHATGQIEDADFAAIEAFYAQPGWKDDDLRAAAVRAAWGIVADIAPASMTQVFGLVARWTTLDHAARQLAATALYQVYRAICPVDAGTFGSAIRACDLVVRPSECETLRDLS